MALDLMASRRIPRRRSDRPLMDALALVALLLVLGAAPLLFDLAGR